MKHFMTFAFVALSFSAFAENIDLNCKMRIDDNKTFRSLSELRESKTELNLSLGEDANEVGNVMYTRVLVNPSSDGQKKSKDEKKNNIVIFVSEIDKKLAKVEGEEDEIIPFDETRIQYKVRRLGDTVAVNFKAWNGAWVKMTLGGIGMEDQLDIGGQHIVKIKCDTMEGHIAESRDEKAGAIKAYREAKKAKASKE
jgi:hypothetical protein